MNLKPYHGLILLIILVSIPLFGHLDETPIQLWDEGRLAMKALEMTTSHNWLITTVNGIPDMGNVKPPLLTWIQAIFIKLLGPNELSVRLPSAFAALATCILIYWFFTWKYIKDSWLGIISNLLLVTSMGFVTLHGTRSGDYDTFLTLCTTAFVLYFFLYLQEGKMKYLYLTFLFVILATYTKGIQGAMFLPALFIYTLATRKSGMLFRKWQFYAGSVFTVVLCFGYYFLREKYNPGYIDAVKLNELGGRFNQVMEGHQAPFLYFFSWIGERAFTYWYPALIAGAIAALVTKDKLIRNLVAYLSLVSLIYMLAISAAQTKCWWYIMPVVPYMAIIAGIFINIVFRSLDSGAFQSKLKYNLLPIAFLIITISPAYSAILRIALDGQPPELWDYVNGDISKVLSTAANTDDKTLNGYMVLGCYDDNLTWYREVIKKQSKPIQFSAGSDPGSTTKVIAFRPETKKYIEDHYYTRITYVYRSVFYYQIEGKKDSTVTRKGE